MPVDVRKRRGYRKNPFMTAAVKKYGWKNIKTEILAENVTLDEANLLETYYIASFETQDRKYGYNICSGGMYFNSTIEEVRKKISDYAKTRVHTEAERFRACLHNENRKEIRCVETGEVFPSVRAAARAINGERKYVRKVANGIWSQYRGLHFEWVERNKDG